MGTEEARADQMAVDLALAACRERDKRLGGYCAYACKYCIEGSRDYIEALGIPLPILAWITALPYRNRAEASEARATALLEALRPFAEAAGAYDVLANPSHSDDLYLNGLLSAFPGISEARIRVGDLRRARAAIAAQQDRQTEG